MEEKFIDFRVHPLTIMQHQQDEKPCLPPNDPKGRPSNGIRHSGVIRQKPTNNWPFITGSLQIKGAITPDFQIHRLNFILPQLSEVSSDLYPIDKLAIWRDLREITSSGDALTFRLIPRMKY